MKNRSNRKKKLEDNKEKWTCSRSSEEIELEKLQKYGKKYLCRHLVENNFSAEENFDPSTNCHFNILRFISKFCYYEVLDDIT